jgi:methionine-rich copper-binding protein CopC/putative copper export protein
MRAPRWWRLAGAIALLALLTSPALPGATGSRVLAHAQLVASSPASGAVLPESPGELRLVFSEPLESQVTSFDLAMMDGTPILDRAGEIDPEDPHAIVATPPQLADGIYSINWRSLSAADGHVTEGFLYFGVGEVEGSLPGASSHEVHGDADVIGVVGRWLTYLGLLAAIGLATFQWLVLRERAMPAGLVRLLAAGLAVAALATLVSVLASGAESGAGPAYLVDSRTGLLQVARAGIAALGAAVLVWGPGRWARPAAIAAGLAGVVLLIAGGHASALPGIVPILAGVVHVVAVGIWLGGVAALLLLLLRPTWISSSTPLALSTVVPRFSALALVSIGLVSITGAYSAWVETGSILPLGTEYGRTLVMKSALAAGAIGLGGLNYLDGGRMRGWLDGFPTRVKVETLLGAAVLVMSAALATTPPVDEAAGVAIEPLPDAFGEIAPGMAMEIVPGRPGVNRFVVNTTAAMIAVDAMELALERLDDGSSTTVPLVPEGMEGLEEMPGMEHGAHVTPNPDGTIDWIADAVVLPAGTSWDASVRILSDDGSELSRQRFAFALDETGISEGAVRPLVTWGAIIALALAVGGAVSLGLGLGGFTLPRCETLASRVALLGGGTVAIGLGLLIGVRQLVG